MSLYVIGRTIEEKIISSSLLINLDQTHTNFVQGTNKAISLKGSMSVTVFRSTNKFKQDLEQSIQEWAK